MNGKRTRLVVSIEGHIPPQQIDELVADLEEWANAKNFPRTFCHAEVVTIVGAGDI
jgi:hypothetical protein